MQKTSRLNRLLAVLVAAFMAVCCLPLNAFAAEKTYMVDFMFHVGDSTGGEYLDDWTKTGVKVEAYNGIMVSDLLEEASVPMPEGYELANPDEKIDIDADRVVDIEVKKIPEEPSEPQEPAQLKKIVHVSFAIDDGDAHGTFAGGQPHLNWDWTDMNAIITSAPEVVVEDGYRLSGWRIQGNTTEYLNADAFGIDPNLAAFSPSTTDGYDEEGYMTVYPIFEKIEEKPSQPSKIVHCKGQKMRAYRKEPSS